MVTRIYSNYFKHALTGAINWPADDIRVALLGEGYIFDAAHTSLANLTDVKVIDSQPVIALANKQVVVGAGTVKVTADNISLSPVTVQAVKGLALYKNGADAASSVLLCYVDLGMVKGVTNGDFGITWSADGIITHSEG